MLPRAAGAGGSSTHNLHAFTRPEPFRQLNGPTMDWPYILVILGIAVILYLIGSLRVLRQYEGGVVFLLGPSDDRGHVHVEVAIKDAFAAARRQIEALAQ